MRGHKEGSSPPTPLMCAPFSSLVDRVELIEYNTRAQRITQLRSLQSWQGSSVFDKDPSFPLCCRSLYWKNQATTSLALSIQRCPEKNEDSRSRRLFLSGANMAIWKGTQALPMLAWAPASLLLGDISCFVNPHSYMWWEAMREAERVSRVGHDSRCCRPLCSSQHLSGRWRSTRFLVRLERSSGAWLFIIYSTLEGVLLLGIPSEYSKTQFNGLSYRSRIFFIRIFL